MRGGVGVAVLALAAVSLGLGAGLPLAAPAQAAPARAQIGGNWDLTWRNRRGERREGRLVVEQRGAALTARLIDRDFGAASGAIAGGDFTLRGARYGLPFTIIGRVKGRKMTGVLTALGIERRFTGTRRRR